MLPMSRQPSESPRDEKKSTPRVTRFRSQSTLSLRPLISHTDSVLPACVDFERPSSHLSSRPHLAVDMEDEEISLQDMAPPKVDQDELAIAERADGGQTVPNGVSEQGAQVPQPATPDGSVTANGTPQKPSIQAEAASTPGQGASDDENQEWEKVEKPGTPANGSGTESPAGSQPKNTLASKSAAGSRVQGAVGGVKKVLKTGVFGGESSFRHAAFSSRAREYRWLMQVSRCFSCIWC